MSGFKPLKLAVCAGFCLLGVGVTPLANAGGYTLTDLGTFGGNSASSQANGINNAGQVVGGASYIDIAAGTVGHATIWSGGAITDLGTLGGPTSRANGINNAGQVVGSSYVTRTSIRATFWDSSASTPTDLGTLGGISQALGINDAGQVGDEASGWKPGKPRLFLSTPFSEREPMFSPDGKWIAYTSNQSGRNEVYVQPFPGPGSKTPISTGGGGFPVWSRTKRELFYSANGQLIIVVPYAVEGDSFRAEKPRPWTDQRFEVRGPQRMFDLHPDGERFALRPQTPRDPTQDHVTFIFNFFDELRRIAPATKR